MASETIGEGLVHYDAVGVSVPSETVSGGAASAPPTDWETAADAICAAMLKRSEGPLRSAAERLYEGLLYDVQDYLRENVLFNLSSELERARRDAAEAQRQLQRVFDALEYIPLDAGPFLLTPAERADIACERIAGLRAKADAATAPNKLAGYEGEAGVNQTPASNPVEREGVK